MTGGVQRRRLEVNLLQAQVDHLGRRASVGAADSTAVRSAGPAILRGDRVENRHLLPTS